MSLESVNELLRAARRNGYAVGYFESWNLESLQGAIDAAEETRSPVLLGFNGEFLSHPGRIARERISWYAALLKAAAESASVPCGLIFNECAQEDWVRLAVAAGFGQVMLDDPEASYEDLCRRVAGLAEYAHQHGVAVEAEVGALPCGSSGKIVEEHSALTDPESAAEFVRATDVDILAVSIGNVHMLVRGRKNLDLDRLDSIRKRVDIPLCLHGGTGIAPDTLRRAISLGVAKVAYGTNLKQSYLAGIRAALKSDEINPHRLLGYGGPEDVMVAGRLAVRDAVLKLIPLLGCSGKA